MLGENITINVKCKPWILEDAPAEDLLKMTERIEKLAMSFQERYQFPSPERINLKPSNGAKSALVTYETV